MDIYSFINSRDIAKHCHEIGHKFTPLEMAFIIYLSDKTLAERHSGWQWIIEEQPDMAILERRCMEPHDSLHQFLADYMAIELKSFDDSKKDDSDMFDNFIGMWLEVPTPFKKGDIVFLKGKRYGYDSEPFVLNRLCYWSNGKKSHQERIERLKKNWDISDMICLGYHVSEDGYIYVDDEINNYLDLEYYHGELEGKHRILKGVSNYVKEKREICEDLLINAYDVILLEEYVQTYRKSLCYINEYLERAGLLERTLEINCDYTNDMQITIQPPDERNWDLDMRESLGPFKSLDEMRMYCEDEDLYSFIPSRDIAIHCRALNHEFTPLEQAVIIFHSKESPDEDEQKTLDHRHKAWQEIIDTQPDMVVTEWEDAKRKHVLYDSLHQFLKDYMRIENSLVEKLKKSEANAVYTYKAEHIYDDPDDFERNDYHYDNVPYSTFEAVMKAVKEESEKEKSEYETWKSKSFYIYKRYIDSSNSLSVQVSSEGEILSDWGLALEDYFSEEDHELYYTFQSISIYVPVPFKKGDILKYRHDGRPFVLENDDFRYGKKKYPDENCFLAEGSISDTIYCTFIQDNGNVYSDFNPASLDIEFYREELKGLRRALIPISNRIKGKIPADLMMNAFDIIIHEERLKDRREDLLLYTEEGRKLAGVSKKHCEYPTSQKS